MQARLAVARDIATQLTEPVFVWVISLGMHATNVLRTTTLLIAIHVCYCASFLMFNFEIAVCNAATTCNNQGTCNPASGTCTCAINWTGAACNLCAPYYYTSSCVSMFILPISLSHNRFIACADTVSWAQTLLNSWQSGGTSYSQWEVTLDVGVMPLYSLSFSLVPYDGYTISSVVNINAVCRKYSF